MSTSFALGAGNWVRAHSTPQTGGQEFRGFAFGVAAGVDGPLDNGALFGLSGSFITSQIEEPGRPAGEIAASFGRPTPISVLRWGRSILISSPASAPGA